MDNLLAQIQDMIVNMKALSVASKGYHDLQIAAFDAELGLRKVEVALLKIKLSIQSGE